MGGNALLPFVCVGLAYFLIAVLAAGARPFARGEVGHWSTGGTIWSLAAGAAGAPGAAGDHSGATYHGNPIYVMPLVFGSAPVVNTFYTIITTKNFKLSPFFLAGLILVVSGAVTVLVFRPGHGGPGGQTLTATDFLYVAIFVAMTALSWGVYGPTLHRGQMAMAGSRLRPLLCVGLSYFLIAVLIPASLLVQSGVPDWKLNGALWSLAGGAAGAVGALGIIMAFNFGGKPIFVMPLVFGGAPVINTFATMAASHSSLAEVSPLFYAGLILVAVGAVTVLVFAPKGGHGPKPAEARPEKKDKPAEPAKSPS